MALTRARSLSSDRLSVFSDEFFATTGGMYGMLYGMDIAIYELSQSISPVESYLHNLSSTGYSLTYAAAMGTIMGKVVATAGPLLVHSIKAKLDKVPTVEETFRYNDYANYSGPRKAGIAVGTIAALALSWNLSINPFEEKKVPQVEPLSPEFTEIAKTPYAPSNNNFVLNGLEPLI